MTPVGQDEVNTIPTTLRYCTAIISKKLRNEVICKPYKIIMDFSDAMLNLVFNAMHCCLARVIHNSRFLNCHKSSTWVKAAVIIVNNNQINTLFRKTYVSKLGNEAESLSLNLCIFCKINAKVYKQD